MRVHELNVIEGGGARVVPWLRPLRAYELKDAWVLYVVAARRLRLLRAYELKVLIQVRVQDPALVAPRAGA